MEKTNKNEIINDFVSTLPDITAYFGLGSAVFKQIGSGTKEGQIDGIGIVDNSPLFHIKNMQLNPKYYSTTGKLFFSLTQFKLTKQVQFVGADICYLTYIKFNEKTFKLGIIQRKDFLDDLLNWKNLYMAGRFMKVTLMLKTDDEIKNAIEYNRKSALIVSLLMLPEDKYNLYELYQLIISLSYKGDFRNGIKAGDTAILSFENPNKINNLLAGQYIGYNNLYSNYPDLYNKDHEPDFSTINHLEAESIINKQALKCFEEINIKPNTQHLLTLIDTLPANLKNYLKEHNADINDLDSLRIILANFFTDINSKVTLPQGIKGIFTSGPVKAIHYGYDKSLKAATKKLRKI